MEKCSVVDVEGHLADQRKSFFPMFGVKNSDVLRDQSSKRVKRQTSHRRLDAALVQFFDHAQPPLFSKSLLSDVPSAANQTGNQGHHQEPEYADREAMGEAAALW